MKNKAKEILEEYAVSYSEVDVVSLANILEKIRRETARGFVEKLFKRIKDVGEKGGVAEWIKTCLEIAAEYGVEVDDGKI